MPVSNRQLWRPRVGAGRARAAFEELYRRTSPWLAVRLRRRCADEQIVAEAMQETYLAVWRAAEAFAGSAAGGSAVGWLALLGESVGGRIDQRRLRRRIGYLPLAHLDIRRRGRRPRAHPGPRPDNQSFMLGSVFATRAIGQARRG